MHESCVLSKGEQVVAIGSSFIIQTVLASFFIIQTVPAFVEHCYTFVDIVPYSSGADWCERNLGF